MIHKIDIRPEILDELKEYGKKFYPEECCGLLTGITNHLLEEYRALPLFFHPIDNVSKEKFKWDYVMEPNKYLKILKTTTLFNKDSALDLSATFHTHPNGMPIPSQYDITGAAWHTVYLIYGVATDDLAAWYWDGTFFKRIPINEESISQDSVHSDGEERIWKSWRDVGLL
jgi:proteasome lid subunit RPN8/RPN11